MSDPGRRLYHLADYGVGSGDISGLLTMHVMQAFCVPMTGAMLMEQEQMVVAWGRNPHL